MHLAIVSPYPPHITGIGQYGYHVSRILAQSGSFSRITVLTGTSGEPFRSDPPGPIQVRSVWHPNRCDVGLRIKSFLEKTGPDLVWFNLGASAFGRSPLANLSGFLSPEWVHRLGIPTVVMLHELPELSDLRALKAPGGPLAVYGATLLTRLAFRADVVCLTLRRYVEWLSRQIPRLPCVHIPIGAYHQPELLEESVHPELLFFTTLAPYKGLELLLEAYASIKAEIPDLRLSVAGTEHARFPGYARMLRQTYQGLTGVRWLGQVPEGRVRDLFRQSQIVVLPYRASTGSSSVLFQSAMWGRPVVASDLPETRAVVEENGLQVSFFKCGNVEDLVRSLKALISHPEYRRNQVAHNLAVIQRNRPEETCRAFLNAFNIALASHSSPKRIDIPSSFTLKAV